MSPLVETHHGSLVRGFVVLRCGSAGKCRRFELQNLSPHRICKTPGERGVNATGYESASA